MADFSLHTYTRLLNSLIEQGYHFQTFEEYLSAPLPRSIVLRHDVDKRPGNALTLAKIESELGLKGTYNFRAKPYFDTDFTKVLYLTDTGRRWDGSRFSIRDSHTNGRTKQQRLSDW